MFITVNCFRVSIDLSARVILDRIKLPRDVLLHELKSLKTHKLLILDQKVCSGLNSIVFTFACAHVRACLALCFCRWLRSQQKCLISLKPFTSFTPITVNGVYVYAMSLYAICSVLGYVILTIAVFCAFIIFCLQDSDDKMVVSLNLQATYKRVKNNLKFLAASNVSRFFFWGGGGVCI